MTQDLESTIASGEPPKKKSNKWWIIGVIVLLLLLCCCAVVAAGAWLWNNGDRLIEQLDIQSLQLVRLLM